MFRDLKEYQQIQKIYEERVCISEEDRYITKELEETFTEDEINFIAENTEEVFAEISNQLVEEGSDITEETIDEMAKAVAKALPLAQRMAAAFTKNVAKKAPVAGGIAKKTASGGGGLMQKAGGLVKKVGGFIKKNVGKIAGTVGAGAAGGAIGAAITKSKPKVERDSSGKIIPSTDSIRKGSDRVGGGNAGASTDSGGTQGQGGAQNVKTTQSQPKKKMHSIEKKNRARLGDEKVDKLKSKQADFKKMRKGEMSKADFIKAYPNSITAQRSKGLRDHTEWDAYDMVLEYLFSTEQVSSLEEANYVMMEMDQETIGSIVSEVRYVLDEGFIDNLKAGISKVKKVAGDVKDTAVKTTKKVISKGKEIMSSKNKVKTLNPLSKENKRIREKEASKTDDNKGKIDAQVSAIKRKRDGKTISDVKAENKAKMIAAAKARNEKFKKDKMKK